MEYDYDMICMDKKMQMRVKTSNLTEELGQVEYVFSDKTGTLTRNIMEFKKFIANGLPYGVDNPTDMEKLSTIKYMQQHPEHQKVFECLRHLSLCHSVILSPEDGSYNASSPDEQALLEGARDLGFVFESRWRDDETNCLNLGIQNFRGEKEEYQLLNILEFNSDRKRMSVVTRNLSTGTIEVLCKGADSVIAKLLKPDIRNSTEFKNTIKEIEKYAAIGLRTLILAKTEIT